MFKIDAHVNVYTIDEPTRARVAALEHQILQLTEQGRIQMAFNDDIDSRMTQMDAATNEIAADLQTLRDQIAAGVSEADKAAVLSKLDDKIARLHQLGQDPTNPVPPAA